MINHIKLNNITIETYQKDRTCCSKDCEYLNNCGWGDEDYYCELFQSPLKVKYFTHIDIIKRCKKCQNTALNNIIIETITKDGNNNLCSKDCKYYNSCFYEYQNIKDERIAVCTSIDKVNNILNYSRY